MNTEACESGFTSVAFPQMGTDMKRMLKMQIKEFVNSIEDYEFELQMKKHSKAMPSVIMGSKSTPSANVA
ncbi:MAG: hypothetical protein K2X81_02225 [Candidatus Obscuribacterales bacterium]|nr:hypothetical protein [Candidatus Obscuribacterales bacterium]